MKPVVLVAIVLAAFSLQGAEQCPATELDGHNWYLGFQSAGGQRNHYDVFGTDDVLPEVVGESDVGGGLLFGHRFGGRFLLGFQVVVIHHDLDASGESLFDVEALITSTVLFRQQSMWQPFLRGGLGLSSEVVVREEGGENMTSLGTGTVAGGGLQVRMSRRLTLEMETAITFANFFEVHDNEQHDVFRQVRTSNYGWRFGLGLVLWF